VGGLLTLVSPTSCPAYPSCYRYPEQRREVSREHRATPRRPLRGGRTIQLSTVDCEPQFGAVRQLHLLCFHPVVGIRCTLSLNPFNPQSLISHLTNSNGCGNLQGKVTLTVSPFQPFLFPQSRVFSANHRFLSSLFSYSYKSLFPQSLYFHIHTKPPGVRGSLRTISPLATRHFPFVLSNLPHLGLSCPSFSRSLRLFSTICGLFCKNAGVCGGHPERNYGTPGWGACKHCSGLSPHKATRGGVACLERCL
jgi:hypothetical protein